MEMTSCIIRIVVFHMCIWDRKEIPWSCSLKNSAIRNVAGNSSVRETSLPKPSGTSTSVGERHWNDISVQRNDETGHMPWSDRHDKAMLQCWELRGCRLNSTPARPFFCDLFFFSFSTFLLKYLYFRFVSLLFFSPCFLWTIKDTAINLNKTKKNRAYIVSSSWSNSQLEITKLYRIFIRNGYAVLSQFITFLISY